MINPDASIELTRQQLNDDLEDLGRKIKKHIGEANKYAGIVEYINGLLSLIDEHEAGVVEAEKQFAKKSDGQG